MSDVEYMFNVIGRPEMMDGFNSALERVGNLKGFDRTKPVGLMTFLKTGLPPEPVNIGYFPVESIDDVLKTLELGPVATRKVTDTENRYELIAPDRTWQIRLQDGFAFAGTEAEMLDRPFPNPDRYSRVMSSRYDLSVTADISSIPDGIRSVFLNYLKLQVSTELQQRDDEADGAYKIRKANGEWLMDLFESMVTYGDKLSIGANASEEDRLMAFEVMIEAKENSVLAQYLKSVNRKRSYFAQVVEDNSPMSLSVSWTLDKNDQKIMRQTLEGIELEIIADEDTPSGILIAAPRLLDSLRETVDAGHLDMFMQFFGQPGEKFNMIGGVKLVASESAGVALTEILRAAQDSSEVSNVEINAETHKGTAFHRIKFSKNDAEGRRIFGEEPAMYVGTTSRVLWIGFGGTPMNLLRQTMDLIEERADAQRSDDRPSPVRFVINAGQWTALRGDEERGRRGRIAQEAFSQGDDRLEIDFRPTETGARVRFLFDEGFIRFMGLQVADGIERGRQRREEARNRRGARGGRDRGRDE